MRHPLREATLTTPDSVSRGSVAQIPAKRFYALKKDKGKLCMRLPIGERPTQASTSPSSEAAEANAALNGTIRPSSNKDQQHIKISPGWRHTTAYPKISTRPHAVQL